MRLRAHLAAWVLFAAAQGAIVLDRLAATAGRHVITESEVIEEIRVTAFLNQKELDFSPAARRGAAERLVDQELLREQIAITGVSIETNNESEKLLDQIRQRYPDEAAFKTALGRYGITLDQLKAHLAWQLAVLRFTDYLFRPNIPGAPAADVDRQLEAWLKQARSQTQIRFFEEAFK